LTVSDLLSKIDLFEPWAASVEELSLTFIATDTKEVLNILVALERSRKSIKLLKKKISILWNKYVNTPEKAVF
jgi:hypothetical protein